MKYCKCGCNNALFKNSTNSYIKGHGNYTKIANWIKPIEKFCNGCKNTLPVAEFYIKTHTSKGNGEKYERLRARCIDCEKKAVKADRVNYNTRRRHRRRLAVKNNNIKYNMQDRIYRYKSRASKINVPFNISKEFLVELYSKQQGKCYYTGKAIMLTGKIGTKNNISLDRLHPEKGYVKGNVVWCSYFVNTMKGALNVNEFHQLLKDILQMADNNPII